jgi:transcriptional regulator with XRE-family HTH domain
VSKELDKKLLIKVINELKITRKSQKIKQEDVYFDTGIHIGRIETGNFDLTLTTLKKLTKYYNTDLGSFFKKIKE